MCSRPWVGRRELSPRMASSWFEAKIVRSPVLSNRILKSVPWRQHWLDRSPAAWWAKSATIRRPLRAAYLRSSRKDITTTEIQRAFVSSFQTCFDWFLAQKRAIIGVWGTQFGLHCFFPWPSVFRDFRKNRKNWRRRPKKLLFNPGRSDLRNRNT